MSLGQDVLFFVDGIVLFFVDGPVQALASDSVAEVREALAEQNSFIGQYLEPRQARWSSGARMCACAWRSLSSCRPSTSARCRRARTTTGPRSTTSRTPGSSTRQALRLHAELPAHAVA